MNNPDSFEEELKKQEFQNPTEAWKKEILARAVSFTPKAEDSWVKRFLWEWILPYRLAYACVAAVWLLILTLHATTPQTSDRVFAVRSIEASSIEGHLLAQWEYRRLQRKLELYQ